MVYYLSFICTRTPIPPIMAATLCAKCRGPCAQAGDPSHAIAHVEADLRCAVHTCLLPARFHDALAAHDHAPRLVRWSAMAAPLARTLAAWPALAPSTAAHAQAVHAANWPTALRIHVWRAAQEDKTLAAYDDAPVQAPEPAPEPAPVQEPAPEPALEPVSEHVRATPVVWLVAVPLGILAIMAVVAARPK